MCRRVSRPLPLKNEFGIGSSRRECTLSITRERSTPDPHAGTADLTTDGAGWPTQGCKPPTDLLSATGGNRGLGEPPPSLAVYAAFGEAESRRRCDAVNQRVTSTDRV